jgi:hypothetical protein
MTAAGRDADAEFLRAFDAGALPASAFGHREHLRLAWILIERDGPDLAAPEIERRLCHLAAAHGMPERYNSTLTLFWVRLVAHVARESEPWLLDTGLARRHYSNELLSSPRARTHWVEPDLIALPA